MTTGVAAAVAAFGIPFHVICVECGRQFDLSVAADADEWSTGHDCEEDA